MKISVLSSSFVGSIVTACLIVAAAGRATASPRSACDVLSLAEVRPGRGSGGRIRGRFIAGNHTRRLDSVDLHVHAGGRGHRANGLGAKFTLMWGPKDKLTQSNDFYIKRHIEASGMKGDVLVVAWIGNASKGKAGDWSASQKLLAAVLQKL